MEQNFKIGDKLESDRFKPLQRFCFSLLLAAGDNVTGSYGLKDTLSCDQVTTLLATVVTEPIKLLTLLTSHLKTSFFSIERELILFNSQLPGTPTTLNNEIAVFNPVLGSLEEDLAGVGRRHPTSE